MRDLLLALATLVMVPICIRFPGAGLIAWAWFAVMAPHQLVYGFMAGQPINSIVAAATLLGWLCSRERKRLTPDIVPWLLLAFTAWFTLNAFFVPYPDWSWHFWNLTVRDFVFVFLVYILATTKARINGLVWAMVIALGYFGVKGGAFTIVSGGHAIVYGPSGTILNDNNQLAAAIVMGLPLVNYLRMHSQHRLIRIGLAVGVALEIIMVFGSHSRGALIAIGATAAVFLLKVRRKFISVIAIAVIGGGGLMLMPQSYFARMDTISHASKDASFEGRVEAWHVAFDVAVDDFPFGAGFYAPQLVQIFDLYLPNTQPHAAHSIYFQVLGEQGFVGLTLYLVFLFFGYRNCSVVIRQTRGRPELLWAHDLANMTRIGLIGFFIGGAALSMAYFDGFLVMIALMSTVRELTAPAKLPARARARPAPRSLPLRGPLEPAQLRQPPAS